MNLFKTPRVTYVPHWIMRAAEMRRISAESMFSYSAMAAILTMQDMAEWMAAFDIVETVTDIATSGSRTRRPLSAARHPDLSDTDRTSAAYIQACALASTTDVIGATRAKLTYTSSYNTMSGFFKIIRTPSGLVVVIAEGFLAYIDKPGCLLDFYRVILKELCALDKVYEVAESAVFHSYVSMLAASVTAHEQKDRYLLNGHTVTMSSGDTEHLFSAVMK